MEESQGLLSGRARQAGGGRSIAAVKLAVLLAAGFTMYNAAMGGVGYWRSGGLQQCADSEAYALSNDCFRLGVAWPLVNAVLATAVFANLILQPWIQPFSQVRQQQQQRQLGAMLSFHDNRLSVASLSAAVALVAVANAAAFVVIGDKSRSASGGGASPYERVYWHSTLAFWVVALCAFGRDLMQQTRRQTQTGVFHWTLIAAVLVQAVISGLAEGFFEFFAGEHVREPVGQSLHSRFVMLSSVASLVAAVLPLYAHQRGFYLPRSRRPESLTEQATEDMQLEVGPDVKAFELHTPLTRVRANQIPVVTSPEHSQSVIGQLVFSWVTPVLSMGTKVTIDSSDLYHLDASDRPLSIWRRYVSCRAPGRSLLRALGLTFVPQLAAQGMLALLNALLAFANPFFMQRILRAIRVYNQGNEGVLGSKRMIYLDAIGLLLASLLHSLSTNQVLWIGRKVSLRLQSLLVAELSSKALRRRSKSSAPTEKDSKKDSDDSKKDSDDSKKDDEDTTAASDGRVANMLTSDLENVGHISSYLNEIYTLPIEFVIGSWYLYNLLGVSALIGLGLTAIYYPLTKLMVKYLVKYQRQLMKLDDERVTMLTEVFYGIRAVKLFGWQSRFVAKVRAKRNEELSAWWRLMLLQLPVSFVRSLTTSVILVAILAIYALVFGNALTADVVFPSITVFSMVSATFNGIPGMFRWMAGCYVSLKRIESFMVQSQVQSLAERVDMSAGSTDGEIGFVDASFVWSIETAAEGSSDSSKLDGAALPNTMELAASEQTPLASSRPSTSYGTASQSVGDDEIDEAPTPVTAVADRPHSPDDGKARAGMVSFKLSDITLRFPVGGMSIVVGPTGSGKSSLLAALIGEMSLTQGRIILPTTDPRVLDAQLQNCKYREVIELASQGPVMTDVAYVSQEAWLRNATIRENVLFGEPYDAERYEEVLRVCALKPDLRLLAAGDRTEIGERGITLSGGQKQRVALARAVYSKRRILLIDDCLSAVDAHTAKHILNACLVGQTGLMQGRTRVLVTHHVSACLPHADYVAVLRNGRLALSGSPQELQMMGHFSTEVLSLDQGSNGKSPAAEEKQEQGKDTEQGAVNVNDTTSEDTYNTQSAGDSEGTLVEDEEREQGYVRPQVWFEYMRMCGGWVFWTVVVLSLFVNRAASIAQSYWVRLWMSEANEGSTSSADVTYWLGTYIMLGMFSTTLRLITSLNETAGGMRAARKYHELLFARLINAMPRFFDCTPIGRVISRFSRDMRTIDDSILGSITVLITQITQVGSVFGIISMVTPPFIVIALAMTVAYTLLAIYYLNATRELKRLDSISMSPLLSLFSELITGVESIRAFGAQNQYTMEAMNRVDVHNRPFYMLWAANRWLCARIEFSGCIVSFSTTVLIVASLDKIDAGLAGFVLMYAISFSEYMLWFIRNYSECEISMNSVERVNQYLVLEQEAAPDSDRFLSDAWPSSGSVEIRNLTVEYVPDTPVLHDLSLSVKHGEKIGVVGRTGAGKSTLSLAFLRFIEAAQGSISIDNVDISQVALDDLRRRITIIPQDPVLFNGTIRFNLDPFDEYPDELIWDALKRAHLVRNDESDLDSDESSECNSLEAIGALDDNALGMNGVFLTLEAEIKENGQNLSLGQRQLVAIARALVRRSRVVILDEATASVDFNLDARIQHTIRGPEFADSTLFCIAHRLRTIIDYDRVLVLDKGKIAEFDTPWNLIQQENGLFRAMCEKSGEFEHLFGVAQRSQISS
ncbi:hypothetical protein GGF43_000870 [Coemansia sp. RSA 2618]|nr:hypothetical protein GGF43_000870 [Coemansia sp. RSA 2618]